jgi:hypothetical protein
MTARGAITTIEASNSLTDLAARIKAEHEACISALQRGLEHAVAAGELLLEAKALIPHGQWLPWLREHAYIPERTAQRYMKIAPWAADKSDKMADLTADAIKSLSPTAFWALGQQLLDAPFTEQDFDDLHYGEIKLLHQAQVPAIAAWCFDIAEYTADDRPALRLCPWDDLKTALEVLAPIATGKRAFKVDCADIQAMLVPIEWIRLSAMWMVGNLLGELQYRDDIDEDRYQTEWDETHQHVMAGLEKQIAAVKGRGS